MSTIHVDFKSKTPNCHFLDAHCEMTYDLAKRIVHYVHEKTLKRVSWHYVGRTGLYFTTSQALHKNTVNQLKRNVSKWASN